MLKNYLLAHRKGSAHYSNLNTPVTDIKNVYIGVTYYFKTNIVSKNGLQLESLSTAQRKAKKMSKKLSGRENGGFACLHASEIQVVCSLREMSLIPSAAIPTCSVPQLAALTTYLQLMAFGTVPKLTLFKASL